jgi:hypothetical protein
VRPCGCTDHPALEHGDENLCHPDSITPRYLRARRRLIESLRLQEAARDARPFRAIWPPITPEEWEQEWRDALMGRATNQGWELPYTGGKLWLTDLRIRRGPRLRLMFRDVANPRPCEGFESNGAVRIINPNLPAGYEVIERGDPDQAERFASYAWPEPPFVPSR